MSSNKFEALGTSDDSENEDNNEAGQHNASNASGNSGGSHLVKMVHKAKEGLPGDHRLQFSYCMWYSLKGAGGKSYDQYLKPVVSFQTCEQFWDIYTNMVRLDELPSHSDILIFKEGIKPMWEDEANRFGGKWLVRLRKGLAGRLWENLLMAMLGEQFMVGEEICGAVVSVRFQEDIISIWNKTSSDNGVNNRIRDTFKRVLNLPSGTIIKYKVHNDSIRKHNFRVPDSFSR